MLFVSFIALSFGVSLAVTRNVTNQARLCASALSPEEVEVAEAHFQSNQVLTTMADTKSTSSIPVHWHVIQAGTALKQGNIPDSQIIDSIKVLNVDYYRTGLRFTLEKIDRTTNENWFNKVMLGTTYQTVMKQTLRKGNAATLNIYTVGFVDVPYDYQGVTGYSTLPYSYARAPMNDGVVILYSTVPGGSSTPFNLGRTLTHEVGHWAGLLHTFQGGCTPKNDRVDDTPWQGEPTSGCPAGKDTCPGGGPDLIHNFMDFSDDACMTGFTPGQIARIKSQVATYRGILV
ncbi:unnamed protein product [Rhizoctonia solani]|uniref:Peptidase M43 pregnancy-associated plasma-A domain-containing protein n=1 Tax=Rhizoctonia solani TaxID=456999 RepID=A0A8H3AWP8_9AGAM|nr:unnamed protein product [Rhizoctonia solani]